ncbi:hypothetical protein [Modestobacter sp. NPDC049651]|uniref:hypothetical protein n=1 Tax=unclassified Modestobacter TaxID=2643866 RepID=UPI0033FAE47D
MTTHRIDLAPADPPTERTARCDCGDWARTYTAIDQWSDTLDAAQRHVSSLCGDHRREDRGQGHIVVFGECA